MSFILIGVILLFTVPLEAKDFGVHGHVFPIQEDSLLDYLQSKLKRITAQEFAKLEDKIREHYLKQAENPLGALLPEAKTYRQFYFDPSIRVAQDILNHEGQVIVAKGTEVNPLKILSLSQELLFFDGRNEAHVRWAKQQNTGAKWILVSGNPVQLEREEKHPVFFDQFGVLSDKLSIQKVPAKVSCDRQKNTLKIEEIPCESF